MPLYRQFLKKAVKESKPSQHTMTPSTSPCSCLELSRDVKLLQEAVLFHYNRIKKLERRVRKLKEVVIDEDDEEETEVLEREHDATAMGSHGSTGAGSRPEESKARLDDPARD